MDRLEVSLIPGTAGAISPFLSPDGQWVGFLSGDLATLQRVSLTGGPPLTICECPRTPTPSWGPDNTIVFDGANSVVGVGGGTRSLFRVSAFGGVPEALTTPAAGETHRNPVFLPSGRAVLFRIVPASGDAQLAVLALDSGAQQVLSELGNVSYVVGFSSRHIVFARDDSLWAVPFDMDRLEVTGAPSLVLEGMAATGPFSVPQVDVSPGGTLVYIPGGAAGADGRTLVWVDRDGREELLTLPPNSYEWPRVSPDGRRVAVGISGDDGDIWVSELARGGLTRVTTDPATDRVPLWTPEGERVVYVSDREGQPGLFRKAADGRGEVERFLSVENVVFRRPPEGPYGWSPDGRMLTFG